MHDCAAANFQNINSSNLMEMNLSIIMVCTILLWAIHFKQHTLKTPLHTNIESSFVIGDRVLCFEISPTRGRLLQSEDLLALKQEEHLLICNKLDSCNTSSRHGFPVHMWGHLVDSLTEAYVKISKIPHAYVLHILHTSYIYCIYKYIQEKYTYFFIIQT